MDNPVVASVVTFVAIIVLKIIIQLAWAKGDAQKLNLARRSFSRVLGDPAFATQVQALLEPPPAKEAPKPKPSGAPLRVLNLLQREGRLLDFLLEDIQPYADEQIGASVREMHRQCQAALKERLILEPVLPQSEGASVTVPAGFDPSAIRVLGNVTGEPPYQGALLHHGWRVKEMKLATPPEGQDEFVVQPAEVEVQ